MNQKFNFCKENIFNMTSFVKAPGELIFGDKYANLSAQAKYLLIIMLARFELSTKNEWIDEEENTYIILPHEEARHLLSCSETKVKRLFSELATKNIIKTKKQGLGKPNLIYVNADLFLDSSKKDSVQCINEPVKKVSEKSSGKYFKSSPDSLKKTCKYNNNKYIKNNYINHISQSKEQRVKELTEERIECKEFIKDIISYNYLIAESYDKVVLDCIVDATVNMLCTNSPMIRVGQKSIPYEEVKRRIYNLDVNSVERIYNNLKNIKNTVKNPTNYLITAIYNVADSYCVG